MLEQQFRVQVVRAGKRHQPGTGGPPEVPGGRRVRAASGRNGAARGRARYARRAAMLRCSASSGGYLSDGLCSSRGAPDGGQATAPQGGSFTLIDGAATSTTSSPGAALWLDQAPASALLSAVIIVGGMATGPP